jgi:phosphoesterase RecJ-like protein
MVAFGRGANRRGPLSSPPVLGLGICPQRRYDVVLIREPPTTSGRTGDQIAKIFFRGFANRKISMAVDWEAFAKFIEPCENIGLISHMRPDCDALGSELGMAFLLRGLGKTVRIVNGQATPKHLRFIDSANEILAIHEDVQPEELSDIELWIVLDTSAWIQLGPMADVLRASKAKKAVVDHHVSEDDLGAELFKDTVSEATGRLVAEAGEALGVPFDKPAANALFAAIATDTGWFRFPAVNSDTYRWIGKLIDMGAVPHEIYAALYEQLTAPRVRLHGVALGRLEVELDGRLVHTYLQCEDFRSVGASLDDTENLINKTLEISSTEAALIFIEQSPEQFKVSFRSRCSMDCSQVAANFGGGGHKAAAGASMTGSLDNVRQRVLDAVRDAMR